MQTGQKIRDYVLEGKIGEGGMGEVWSAHHSALQRQVAIKFMAPQLAADPKFADRFLQEARAQAALQHPRILGVTDFFSEDGVHCLVMPLMSGESLADRIDRKPGPFAVDEALSIARDVLDALDYAHQRGIIHRDVKPSNIMLDRNGHAHLMDFGIALALGQQRLTRTGTSLGTPHYISPEQIRNAKTLDHRADVYSMGCVLYEMLAGRPPFTAADEEGDTDFVLKEAHMYHVPQPIRTWNPAIPQALDAAVLGALAKDPNQRYGGCGEFRRALETWDRPGTEGARFTPAPSGGAPHWYYAKNGQRLGPVDENELRRLMATGQLARTDLVWNPGLPDWKQAGTVPSLLPRQATPPPPPPSAVRPPSAPFAAMPTASPVQPQPIAIFAQAPAVQTGVAYAGFGARLGAILIDLVIVVFGSMVVGGFLAALVAASGDSWGPGPFQLIGFVLQWFYFALFESSAKRGTPGKRMLGLAVTDLEGRQISFGRATGRYFGKIVSGLVFCLGYLAVLWTPRRQAWHDSMAGCLVLRTR